jgi:hypothetical protein
MAVNNRKLVNRNLEGEYYSLENGLYMHGNGPKQFKTLLASLGLKMRLHVRGTFEGNGSSDGTGVNVYYCLPHFAIIHGHQAVHCNGRPIKPQLQKKKKKASYQTNLFINFAISLVQANF